MNANTRYTIYVVTGIVGFVTLVGTIYAQVLDPTRLVEAIAQAGQIATSLLAVLSGIVASRHVTPDPL